MEEIATWLKKHGITSCDGLRENTEFLDFLQTLYPHKILEQIREQVRMCCIAMRPDLENFIGCVNTGLSNK